MEIDVPEGIIGPGLSGHLGELMAVVGLRSGSRVTGGLSARGLANVAVGDRSDDFTFIVGDHRCRCPSSVAQFLSPLVSKLHLIDATISELRLEIEDRDELFGSVLEAAKGNSIAVDSDHRGPFEATCASLWNSELCELVCGQQRDEFTMDNVLNRLEFRSANGCDISAELEFVASHFDNFLLRPPALTTLPFSLLYEIIGHGSLRLETEDSFFDFIRKGTEMNPKMFGLLEFVRFEYCSREVMNDLFDVLWENSYEINASMWATLCARLIPPSIDKRPAKQFPPSVKRRKLRLSNGMEIDDRYDTLDGIIAHLTKECGGNVHDCQVVDVTCGSFEKETEGANPHSGHIITSPRMRQRMQLIWLIVRFSIQLIAKVGRIFLTQETIDCATISRRGGLCQLTTQSARIMVIGASLI
jgi:hypothetical protein